MKLRNLFLLFFFISLLPVSELKAEPVQVYDKADWHLEGEWPTDLPDEQAYVHIGFYLAWLVDRGHISAEFRKDHADDLAKYQKGEMSGPQLVEKADGALVSDMLDSQGNAFTKHYFEDLYLEDYERLFPKVDSLYEVKDTKDNYRLVKDKIDNRFTEWKNRPK